MEYWYAALIVTLGYSDALDHLDKWSRTWVSILAGLVWPVVVIGLITDSVKARRGGQG